MTPRTRQHRNRCAGHRLRRRRHVCGDRSGARAARAVLLAERSLIGRGGATVMAQMTVAAALGEEVPDDPQHHLCRHHRRRPRPVRRETGAAVVRGRARVHPRARRLGRRLGAQRRPHHRDHGARPRPAALRLCRFHQYRPGGVEDAAHADRAQGRRSARPATSASSISSCSDGEAIGAVGCHLGSGAPVVIAAKATIAGDRRPDAALSPQQRLGQYGRRRLRAGACAPAVR